MKRIVITLTLCLALLAICAVAETTGTKVFQLGDSVYTVEIPETFVEGEMTEEDIADDMVAYMHSPDTLLDFDVYMFDKAGYPDTIAEFVAQEAAEYEAAEVVTDGDVNGIDAGWYRATETYEGKEYTTLTYVLEDGVHYVEIAFWLDGETAEAEAQAIISTLTFIQRSAAGIANPWVESTSADIAEAIGAAFGIPEGAGDIAYSLMPDAGLAQMRFTLNGMDCVARIQPAEAFTDISGMFYEWEAEAPCVIALMEGLEQRATVDGETIDLCQWFDADMGLMYSLSVCGADLDSFDITQIAGAIYAQAEEAQ